MIFLLFCSFSFAEEPTEEDFIRWVENYKKTAIKQYNIKKELLDKAFEGVKLNERIIHLDRNQPEHKKTFWEYYGDITKNDRVENGKKYLKKYDKLLKEVQKKYNIPPNIIIAFWDMETHFGRNIGKSYIINVLANLAFEPRRTVFFSQELMYALLILQKKQVHINNFKSSWAGAFGNFQFMPSTFTNYAVDGDRDGRIDLYNSIPDAMYSAANYLNKLGYDGTKKWGRAVYISDDNDKMWDLVNIRGEWHDLKFYADNGVKTYGGKSKIPVINIQGRLVAPMGREGPVFLVYKNFDIIMRWNNSTKYALSIGLLSDEYVGEETILKKIEKH